MASIERKGALFAAGYLVGMARDPLRRMRSMGLAAPSATQMALGIAPGRSRRLLYLTGGENVRPIFTDTATFITSNVPLRGRGGGAQARLRRGLIGAQGAEHRHYRANVVALTGRAMMAEFAASVGRHADAWLRDLPADEPIDLVAIVTRLVRHYAVVTLFKDDDPETAFAIGRDITAWIELGYRPANVLMPLDIPGLPHARYRRAAEDMEGRILRWASRRRGMSAERDILSMFVNGPDETGAPLSEDRLAGHILTIYAASFTSSVASLIWSLFLLMQHPGIAHDLCDELEGSGLDPAADGMRILDLPLLDRVLKESMRLLTPVPYQVRRVTREVHAAGADLRPRDIVVIGSWATNRLACVYPEAERFRPERWATADANSFDYLTFSAGPRRCLGYGLAMIMVKITLATILARRRPSLVANARIDTKVAVTLRSRRPIPVVMAGRDARFLRSDVRGTITDLYAR